ncbi:hypothetical protein BDE36_1403 [Arcticibacter tournemirensis]|nr:hypothetical protein BDE36_1403 [Arcticibacter tournemirensis]
MWISSAAKSKGLYVNKRSHNSCVLEICKEFAAKVIKYLRLNQNISH